MGKIARLRCLIATIALVISAAQAPLSAAAQHRNVLILYSYNDLMPWQMRIHAALQDRVQQIEGRFGMAYAQKPAPVASPTIGFLKSQGVTATRVFAPRSTAAGWSWWTSPTSAFPKTRRSRRSHRAGAGGANDAASRGVRDAELARSAGCPGGAGDRRHPGWLWCTPGRRHR